MSKKKAAIGDIVHYTGGLAEPHRAALVIGIADADAGRVHLAIFRDGAAYGAGPIQATSVGYAEDPQPHSWHWPEKE
jgi:hypothetical protein